MTTFEALLYGAVQGVTEYLPISSSAHLILLPRFLGTQDPGLTFDVFLHLGTLCATLGYFWKDWWSVLKDLSWSKLVHFKKSQVRSLDAHAPLFILIAVATVPALLMGALLHTAIETVLRGNGVLMTTLTLGGLALWGLDRYRPEQRGMSQLTLRDAVGIGLFQCLALVPGMSRSGSTMMGARLLGLDRESAARFSFLISAPITAAALIFELRKFDQLLESQVSVGILLIALASSFLFGVAAIGGLLKIVKRFGYGSFAIYRAGLAAMIGYFL